MAHHAALVAAVLALALSVQAALLAPTGLRVAGPLPSSGDRLPVVDAMGPVPFSFRCASTQRGDAVLRVRTEIWPAATANATRWTREAPLAAPGTPHSLLGAHLPLLPGTAYRWRAACQSRSGEWSAWSTAAAVATAPDWSKTQWIEPVQGGNYLRTEVSLSDSSDAVLYVSGVGFFQLFINGRRVGDDVLSGAWTTWNERVLYFAYNVSSYLNSGTNAIGVSLGVGWRDTSAFPAKYAASSCDSHERLLRLALVVQGKLALASDGHWTSNTKDTTPLLSDSVYNGETYDARREQDGWNKPGFKPATAWDAASPVSCFTPVMTPSTMPGMGLDRVNHPVSISRLDDGSYVVDFGINLSGFCRLNVTGTAGTEVTLRYAEVLMHPPYGPENGDIYQGNLRSAKATDVYTLRGEAGGETYQPHFTYHGFRYVKVSGYPGSLTPADIAQIHFRTLNPIRAQFNSSSTVLNAIQLYALTGQASNSFSVPTDCDQRDERLGWMGDAGLSADTFALNFDVQDFQNNYLRNMKDQLDGSGSLPDVVPFARYGGRPADPSWSAAFPQNVWARYTYAGDLEPAREYLDDLLLYLIDIASQVAKAGGMAKWPTPYGDWVPAGHKVAGPLCSSYNYIVNVRQIAELADKLGNDTVARNLTNLSNQLVDNFKSAFYDPLRKCFDDCGQSSYALAMTIGAFDGDMDKATERLVDDIVNKQKNHVTVGIIGAKALFPILTKMKQHDVAVSLAEQTSYPSWGYMFFNTIEPSVGSVWELWNAPTEGPGMNSRNHHMFSSISAWLVQSIGGISNLHGFDAIEMQPAAARAVSRAETTLDTKWGQTHLAYRRIGGIQCIKMPEVPATHAVNPLTDLDCGEGVIAAINFASWGQPSGQCGNFTADHSSLCSGAALEATLAQRCLGKTSCRLSGNASDWAEVLPGCRGQGHNPRQLFVEVTCSSREALVVDATVPLGTQANIRLPLLHGAGKMVLQEHGVLVARNGRLVLPPGDGILAFSEVSASSTATLTVASGEYSLRWE
eukprot:m.11086 g.11086  ORF g.11086 m.11086 type:complete len:1023 (-) comp3129_c0_seq1:88-3156(-)